MLNANTVSATTAEGGRSGATARVYAEVVRILVLNVATNTQQSQYAGRKDR